jgi:hypothetical protein
MHRYSLRAASVLLLSVLVVGGTAGVSGAAAAAGAIPTLTSAVNHDQIPTGGTVIDTATVNGNAADGPPTGSVTFGVCGPTSSATACTSPNDGSAIVNLTSASSNRSKAKVSFSPGGTAGWYCFLDQYSGDSQYAAVSGNDPSTECVHATKGGGATPTITSAFDPPKMAPGNTSVDTVTVTGNVAHGAPTGDMTFYACGPTAKATPCTNPNQGPATVEVSQVSDDSSQAQAEVEASPVGWYCLLEEYSGDSYYKPVSDNSAPSECVHVTNGGGGGPKYTPTISSAARPKTVAYGNTALDTITVTGNATAGSPSGYVDVYACGPTSAATPCTSPNAGPADVQLSPESGDRATGSATLDPGSPGWYCFLDQYTGDSNYRAVSDNKTGSECVDVTDGDSATQGRSTTLTTAGQSSSGAGPAVRLFSY